MSSYIERIEAHNFKSFRRKKVINFTKGLNVISGPNGSGKSNIGDMLLFVLGTKSIHAVRADRLSDLVSKGSGNECSVSVTFRSDDGRSLVIERRLVIEDEPKSYYYVNGVRSRLSEIDETLASMGINFGTYSFVLQGDINDFISYSGQERRKLIERISGVDQFDSEIERVKADIEAVSRNMEINQTIIDEKRQNLERLRTEKEKKERYDALLKRKRDVEYTEILNRKNAMERQKRTIEGQISDLTKEIAQLEERRSDLEKRSEAIRIRREDVAKRIDDLTSGEMNRVKTDLHSVEVDIAKIRGIIDEKNRNMEKLEETIAKYESERDSTDREIEDLDRQIEEKAKRKRALEDRYADLKKRYDDLFSRAQAEAVDAAETRRKSKEYQEKIDGLGREIEELKAAGSQMNADLAVLLQKKAALEERKEDLDLKIRTSEWKAKETSEDMGKYSRKYYDLKAKYDQINDRISDLKSEISEKEASAKIASSRVPEYVRNVKMLEESVEGVIGLVRDLISYGEKYVKAVESAGGGRLNAVVVKDDAVAKECIQILKDRKISPMTFLPLNKMRDPPAQRDVGKISKDPGYLGILMDFVDFEDQYRSAVYYAIRDTILVQDIDAGRRLMGIFRLVTLDGDIFDPGGSITGGYRNYASDYASALRMQHDLEGMKIQLSSLMDDRSRIKREMDQAFSEMSEASRRTGEIMKEQEMLKKEAERSREELKQVMDDISSTDRAIADKKRMIDENEKVIEQKTLDLHKYQEALNDLYDRIDPEFFKNIGDLSNEINEVRSEIDAVASELNQITSRRDILSSERKHLEDQMIDTKLQENSIAAEIDDLNGKKRELEEKAKKYQYALNDLEGRYGNLSAQVREADKQIREMENGINDAKASIDLKNDLMNDLKVKAGILEGNLSSIERELSSYSGCEAVIGDLQAMRQEIERAIMDLGEINNAAPQQYEDALKDLDDYEKKHEKLMEEKKALEETTAMLNEKKREVFVKTFTDISEKMNYVYGIINGGTAKLIMIGSDPLTSSVEVSVTPKDKATVKIQALSGGEKSVAALSFITAVQILMPSSIYFLDEVDMYLDAYNAENMIKMISQNAGEAQTIVISLKSLVFSYASNAIGVTSVNGESFVFNGHFDGSPEAAP
ncbi:chromosome segregation protein related ptotein [Thermoplasma acidophilum]|uniref:Chromosome partition protein Smc n=1 Tax=Thermoplasma acidophilum (strain ATCC 25905 / DSM 1728 / JCM 9062 / NBRC 15155 / AMRC-C165) TaxID=273075 RepID=SMC_THEAC|nr:chromosome segregation protein SMC [Thermoplasma acidophilum]Q9HK21.1 RecName: Full=Chromosome partition protein Smc [Thermoplasma acidophilum DSM 1728]CAC11918.1 chromosome segregation protein related ptotein [Thermoplasma acidophilum]